MRPKPAQTVLDWFTAQDSTKRLFSAVAELRTGAAILPAGKCRDSLTATIDIMITEDFAGRVLPFDSAVAKAYAPPTITSSTERMCALGRIAKRSSRAFVTIPSNLR